MPFSEPAFSHTYIRVANRTGPPGCRAPIESATHQAHVVASGTSRLTAAAVPAINFAPRFSPGCAVPDTFSVTERNRVVREPDRAAYDRDTIYRILDEGIVCHVGFTVENQPYVIPTLAARVGEAVYFHGSAASRMLRNVASGIPVCLTVTLVDGIVLARSVFNHSMNYRSVVVLGTATPVEAPVDKLDALRAFTEKLIPGRWNDARQPNERELKATSILRLPINEASAKVRSGPPQDDEEDYAWKTWAGVVPLRLVAEPGIPDERCDRSLPVPRYAASYARPSGR